MDFGEDALDPTFGAVAGGDDSLARSAALTAAQRPHILGAEGALWSEYIACGDHLEYMAFPRAIALAEVTWSPPDRRDFADFRRRLALHEDRLTYLGAHFWPVARLDREASFPPR